MRRSIGTPLLFLASAMVCALTAEIVLRVQLGTPVHFRYPQPYYVPDPEIGHWLKPGQRSFNHDEPMQVNSVGIRGRDYSREVPPGTYRVLALGDSQTFGNGLALEETWPALLEHYLDARDGRVRAEVVNGGLSSTDTWQHERILERLARSYEFDSVIVGFYVNDVAPIYIVDAPEQRTNTLLKRSAYLAKRSALATFLWQSYNAIFVPWRGALKERRIISGEPDPGVEHGWKQVETSMAAMKARTDELGASLLVLVIPRRDQVSGREPGRAYNERIAEIGSHLGIPIVDALPALQEAYLRNGDTLFIPWDGHNTGLANRIMALELVGHVR